MVVEQIGKIVPGLGGQGFAKQTEILVAVGIAAARRELQTGGLAEQLAGGGIVEHAFDRRAAQHCRRPIVAQAGLVLRQMPSGGRAFTEFGQRGADMRVEGGQIRVGGEHGGTGELLADRADPEQRSGREGQPVGEIGKSPGLPGDHLPVAQYRNPPAWAGIGQGQVGEHAVEIARRGHRFS